MYVLIVKGARNSTLAYHKIESDEALQEMLAVYRALGHAETALIVEPAREPQAA